MTLKKPKWSILNYLVQFVFFVQPNIQIRTNWTKYGWDFKTERLLQPNDF